MVSTKLVAVIGATGQQGGSVIEALRNDPSFKIRAITRNVSGEQAQKLSDQGIEVVAADCSDVASLTAAFQGVDVIFAVTNFWEPLFVTGNPEQAQKTDYDYGKNLADAAASVTTLSHYIWSTIPSGLAITDGKVSVPHFEGKAKVDEYILNELPMLAAKTTFLWVTYYGLNSFVFPMLKPTKLATSGKYVILQPCGPDTPVTTIGLTSRNVGLFARAILEKPALTLPAKYVLAETDTITTGDLTKLLGDIFQKNIEYVQVSITDYDKLWPVAGLEVGLQMQAWEVAKDRSWAKEGVIPVTKEDLEIEGLIGLNEALFGGDWSQIE